MTGSLFKTMSAGIGQHIIGASTDGFGAQPFILDQPEDRGTYQPFVERQRFKQANQATEPDTSAARQYGIAENGNDERTGLNAALLPKIVKAGLNGLGHDGLLG